MVFYKPLNTLWVPHNCQEEEVDLGVVGVFGCRSVEEGQNVAGFSSVYCTDTIQQIRNKYSQKSNCAATVPNFHIHILYTVYIPWIGMPILLQENMWADPGNT
jgi:hypothetical protein